MEAIADAKLQRGAGLKQQEQQQKAKAAVPVRFAEEHVELVDNWSDSEVSEGELESTVGELKTLHWCQQAAEAGEVRGIGSAVSSHRTSILPSRRIDAVLGACHNFLKTQRATDAGSRSDAYSLLTFNAASVLHFHSLSLARAEQKLQEMRVSRRGLRPHGETQYLQGFAGLQKLLCQKSLQTPTDVRVIFLSDGRPHESNMALTGMAQLVTSSLVTESCSSLVFHTIGFGKEVENFQKYLMPMALKTKGAFRYASLNALDLSRVFTTLASTITTSRGGAATAADAIQNPMSTPFSAEIEDERFIRTCRKAFVKKVQEKTQKHRPEGKVRKEYNMTTRCESVQVRVDRLPFAHGGMRCVYHMSETCTDWGCQHHHGADRRPATKLVAKRATRGACAGVDDVMPFCKSSGLAFRHAHYFMKACKEKEVDVDMAFIPVSLYTYKTAEDEEVAFLGEMYLSGEFVKYNGNNGYVNEDAPGSELMQAYSHFTFIEGKAQHMVVDVQGVYENGKFSLTDPQVLTRKPDTTGFGAGDLGQHGIQLFFEHHRCGPTCMVLGLQHQQTGLIFSLQGQEPRRCLVCTDAPPMTVLQPCGHSVVCETCVDKLKAAHMPCPVCQKPIRGFEKGLYSRTFAGAAQS